MTTDAVMHNGPCIVCMNPTDTALTFRGVAEWCVAGLVTLGLPTDEAIDTYEAMTHIPDANGDYTVHYRVCRSCVRKCRARFPDPGITLDGAVIPVILQPGHGD